jgi:hypothetical protein
MIEREMARTRDAGSRLWARGVVLFLVAAGSAALISCGSGGSSNGGLCEQCGQTDGPCQPSVTVSGSDAQTLCPSGQTSCDIQLACFRKLGSAQRRCFPADAQFEQFRCDGERANRQTPSPILTPTPTPTLAPTSTGPTARATGVTPTQTASAPSAPTSTPTTPTPAPSPTAVCGNGILEGDEECDGTVIDNSSCAADVCTCDDFCDNPGGTLSCNADCTVNFSQCTGGGCAF